MLAKRQPCVISSPAMKNISLLTILAIGLIQLAAFAGCADNAPPPAASPTAAATDDGGAPAPAPAAEKKGGW